MSERGITRREVMQRITATLGGAALIGGERLLALSFDDDAAAGAMAQGVGLFSAADVAFLDEVADTILPETTSPGAKAAKTGAFMAFMVTSAYTERDRDVFRDGLRQIDAACRSSHGATFMSATPAQRLAVLEVLDREQKTAMAERANPPRPRAPAAASGPDVPAHYFRMMKELALLGFFTSEIGCTRALRYIEAPGRYDPCAPLAPGDKSWAGHA
jgi:hypothetical protein